MYRLILCEDDFQIRSGLEHFFPWQQIGFELCACFENGKQALEYLRRQPADVVLTDIRMPVMDGLALARAMRQEKLPTRVVIISAYRDFEYAREAMQ
ncbi:MAG: response regulator, partial [Clostridia bacterium]